MGRGYLKEKKMMQCSEERCFRWCMETLWSLKSSCLSACTALNELNAFMWKFTGSGTSGAQFSFDLMSPLSLESPRLSSDTNKTAEEMSLLIRAHILKSSTFGELNTSHCKNIKKFLVFCLKVNLLKWKLRVWSCKMHVDVDAFQDNLFTTKSSIFKFTPSLLEVLFLRWSVSLFYKECLLRLCDSGVSVQTWWGELQRSVLTWICLRATSSGPHGETLWRLQAPLWRSALQ